MHLEKQAKKILSFPRSQPEEVQALQDTIYVIGGKWRLPIINSICNGNKRFRDIQRSIPGITTRRAETTVELGSGQAFMIGGLMSNGQNTNVDKAPFLGDLPVIGALFRSNGFKRNETELMIVVTPYLVKPVSQHQIALPTDGLRAPTDAQRIIEDQTFIGKSGEKGPKPIQAPPQTVPSARVSQADQPSKSKAASVPDAGFSLN